VSGPALQSKAAREAEDLRGRVREAEAKIWLMAQQAAEMQRQLDEARRVGGGGGSRAASRPRARAPFPVRGAIANLIASPPRSDGGGGGSPPASSSTAGAVTPASRGGLHGGANHQHPATAVAPPSTPRLVELCAAWLCCCVCGGVGVPVCVGGCGVRCPAVRSVRMLSLSVCVCRHAASSHGGWAAGRGGAVVRLAIGSHSAGNASPR
jgi:hypothetical protein